MQHKTGLRFALVGASFSAIGLALSSQAYAQATGVDSDTIVVTAEVSKLDVPIAETPQAISVIDRDQLDLLNVQSVEEGLRYATGVQAERAGRSGYDEFTIRGFSQSRYQFRDGLGLDPGYLQQQEQFGLERIEVLRGPASVLYGEIAPGGLINSVSKVADGESRLDLEASAGSFGLWRGAIDLGGAVGGNETLSYRVSALYSQHDDPQDFANGQRAFIQPSLTWRPDANTSLTLLGLYQNDEYIRTSELPVLGTIAATPSGTIDPSTSLSEPFATLESPQAQIGYLFDHQFSDAIKFRSRLRYLDYQVKGPFVLLDFSAGDPRSVDRLGFNYDADFTNLSLDNQVEFTGETGAVDHRLLVGVDYNQYRSDGTGVSFDLPAIDPFAPVHGAIPGPTSPFFSSHGELDQVGVYAQYRATLADHFVGVFGARRSRVTNRNDDLLSATTSEVEDNKTTINAALMYLAPEGFSPYVSYAESFQPQIGFDPLADGSTPPPALGEQIEAGLKWVSQDGRLEATIAAYRIDQTNVVNSDPTNPGFSVLVGEQRHTGVELEGAWTITDTVELRGSYSFIDAEITRSLNGDAGFRPLNVPDDSAYLLALVDGALVGLQDTKASLGLRYVGQQQNGFGPSEPRLPDYVAVDLGASYDVGNATLGLSIKNLFDEDYFTSFGFGGVVAGLPRTVELSIRTSL